MGRNEQDKKFGKNGGGNIRQNEKSQKGYKAHSKDIDSSNVTGIKKELSAHFDTIISLPRRTHRLILTWRFQTPLHLSVFML